MVSILETMLKLLSSKKSKGGNEGMPHEHLAMGEEIDIKLVRNGKVVKTMHKKGHTWTVAGLHQICLFLCKLTCATPDSFNIKNGATLIATVPIASMTVPTDTSTELTYRGTYSTTSTVSFTTLELVNTASSIVFSTASVSGTKPAEFSLEIEWNNSIGAV